MNLRELKGSAIGSCTFCGTVASCTLYARSDGRELLVCGAEECTTRLRRAGTVHEDRDHSLTDARTLQDRNPEISTEL